jgi:hypothetical protein
VLRLLERQGDGAAATRLIGGLVRLDATADDRLRARELVLRLLERQGDGAAATRLIGGLVRLDATADDRLRARELVLRLLERQGDAAPAAVLIGELDRLDPTADDRGRAHGMLLRMLADCTDIWDAANLAHVLLALDTTEDDVRLVLEAMIRGLLAETAYVIRDGQMLVDMLVDFTAQIDDRQPGRTAILDILANPATFELTEALAAGLLELQPTEDDKRRAREIIIRYLAEGSREWHRQGLVHCLVWLDPIVPDLSSWNAWGARPTGDLIAAVRQNSGLTAWLAALPSLAPLSS